jgi:hypothetical protein
MAKKLTEGQKVARKIVRESAKRVIAELDDLTCRRNSVEFETHFHLRCWEYFNGNPNHKQGSPVYISLIGRLPR